MLEKPATESSVAQGPSEWQTLFSSDKTVNVTHSHLSAILVKTLGYSPMDVTVLDGNIIPGRYKTG